MYTSNCLEPIDFQHISMYTVLTRYGFRDSKLQLPLMNQNSNKGIDLISGKHRQNPQRYLYCYADLNLTFNTSLFIAQPYEVVHVSSSKQITRSENLKTYICVDNRHRIFNRHDICEGKSLLYWPRNIEI